MPITKTEVFKNQDFEIVIAQAIERLVLPKNCKIVINLSVENGNIIYPINTNIIGGDVLPCNKKQ